MVRDGIAIMVDWDGDGTFGNANANVYSDFIRLEYRRGRNWASQLAGAATAGVMDVQLRNLSNLYSSFNSAGSLFGLIIPGRKVEIQMGKEAFPYTFPIAFGQVVWAGYLDDVKLAMEPGGMKSTRIRALGPLSRIGDKVTSEIAVATSVTTGTAIQNVINDADSSLGVSLDTGDTTMTRWWSHSERAINALRKIEHTEMGYIGESPTNQIVFEERSHRMVSPHTVSQATFSDAGSGLSYSNIEQLDPIRELFNYFVADITLYTVGSIATLWTLAETGSSSPSLAAGESKTFVAHYPNPQSATDAVHVDSWTTPVATTDYLVNTLVGGGGSNITSSVSVEVSKASQLMFITLTNDHATSAGFITALKARGTPVAAGDPIQVVEEDATSQAAFGKRTFPVKGPWIPSHAEAVEILRFMKSIHKDPIRTLSITFPAHKDVTHQDAARQLDISDRITIEAENDTGLGINDDFFIESMIHRVFPNGEHWVTYECSEATAYGGFWVLGSSKLGLETKLAF